MVIWRITGNEIGPDGNGASHFATKAQAAAAWRDWVGVYERSDEEGNENATQRRETGQAPHKIVVRNREQLAALLDEAMGFGCS